MKKIYFLVLALGLFTSVSAQIINFPDANFKAKLLAASPANTIAKDLAGNYFKIDANSNGEIEANEASAVSYLNVSQSSIASLQSIENFYNLKNLLCQLNLLSSLDLSGCPALLSCNSNNNQLVTLNVNGLSNLEYLYCTHNQLTNLYSSGLVNLKNLMCSYNQLSSLNLVGQVNLLSLYSNDNQLLSLDISNSTLLNYLNCSNNQLTSINMKNGSHIGLANFNFPNNPNLNYICIDDADLGSVQTRLNEYGYTNCQVNSYCSFVPGGNYYTIQGNSKYDFDNNGCDNLDIIFPNLKFSITDGSISGTLISTYNGNYSIPVQEGTYTITPILENPNYFTISPTNLTVNFPLNTSPLIQNFCITPLGVIKPDLEVFICPINEPIPGFYTNFRIIYKNKGNITQSGSVNLGFNDAVLNLSSSNPLMSSQAVNNLSWNFTNLQPLETRQIIVALYINSPMETPAVNDSDILNYTATITSAATDDTPNDNTFVLRQTVVNSFDPNDKTCLEGATIAPSEVGKYVHYMIRFENNGTANAQNIVVKDLIDLTKFDINSLIPMKGSHSFVTKITSGNKVEFIFQNINLPFDNANNDGYVAFKIKTKPTLVLGNTFSNTASIYFDYNFPIVTNTATTTIAVLGRQDFEFADYFNVYPNPVSDVLNISTKETIEVSSINIYNTLGQLVLVIPNAKNIKTIDVSDLTEGNYFIKINSDKGVSNTKFIKN